MSARNDIVLLDLYLSLQHYLHGGYIDLNRWKYWLPLDFPSTTGSMNVAQE
jgi:hypothetical protein